jgi:hypothetical protein
MELFPHPRKKYRNRVPSFKGLGKCTNLSSKRNRDWSHTTLGKKFLEIGSASTQRAAYCGRERRTIDTMGIDLLQNFAVSISLLTFDGSVAFETWVSERNDFSKRCLVQNQYSRVKVFSSGTITPSLHLYHWKLAITRLLFLRQSAEKFETLTAVTHLLITKYILKLAGICGFCNVNNCT